MKTEIILSIISTIAMVLLILKQAKKHKPIPGDRDYIAPIEEITNEQN